MEGKNTYLKTFSQFEKKLTGNKLSWLRRIRNSAIARFAELDFPTIQHEDWRFTNTEPIAKTAFKLANGRQSAKCSDSAHRSADKTNGLKSEDLKPYAFDAANFCQLVFVNGHYTPEFSFVRQENAKFLENLSSALYTKSELIKSHLSKYADVHEHAFTALNTAFFTDGVFVHLPKDTVMETPIHLLFISIPQDSPTVSYPRILIVTEQDTKATIIESYVGLGRGIYFTNTVTEIVAGENAAIDYYKIQRENIDAFHVDTLQVLQNHNSRFNSHSISLGGALVRNNIYATLDAESVDCILNGLYLLTGQQHVDNHTTIDHVKPHSISRELYKGILNESARAVFNGKIIVRQDAQKTDAMQTNKNLLLSDDGWVHTKPELKIFANDVKCKHGANVGQINRDPLFYLRSRGISQEEGKRLLTNAFASEMMNRMTLKPIREELGQLLFSYFQNGKG